MTVRDAKLLYPAVIVLTPDPAKYRAVHLMFCKIFRDYSPDVTPKSIDEAVIDLTDTLRLFKGTVVDIGMEIKKRFRRDTVFSVKPFTTSRFEEGCHRAQSGQGQGAPPARGPAALLDLPCARRPAGGQIGTTG